MNITSIVAKSTFLRLHPEAWDALIPHGPVFGTAIREYVVGTLVRQIRNNPETRQFATQLDETAKALVASSSKMLPSEFAKESLDTDDLCPPYLGRPIPPPRGDEGPGPDSWFGTGSTLPIVGLQPDPWLEYAPTAIREIAIAVALRDLANVTTIKSASSELKEVGEALIKQAGSRVFDEYCATPARPHVPGIAAKAIA
jgi:hypothetical protein